MYVVKPVSHSIVLLLKGKQVCSCEPEHAYVLCGCRDSDCNHEVVCVVQTVVG